MLLCFRAGLLGGSLIVLAAAKDTVPSKANQHQRQACFRYLDGVGGDLSE